MRRPERQREGAAVGVRYCDGKRVFALHREHVRRRDHGRVVHVHDGHRNDQRGVARPAGARVAQIVHDASDGGRAAPARRRRCIREGTQRRLHQVRRPTEGDAVAYIPEFEARAARDRQSAAGARNFELARVVLGRVGVIYIDVEVDACALGDRCGRPGVADGWCFIGLGGGREARQLLRVQRERCDDAC